MGVNHGGTRKTGLAGVASSHPPTSPPSAGAWDKRRACVKHGITHVIDLGPGWALLGTRARRRPRGGGWGWGDRRHLRSLALFPQSWGAGCLPPFPRACGLGERPAAEGAGVGGSGFPFLEALGSGLELSSGRAAPSRPARVSGRPQSCRLRASPAPQGMRAPSWRPQRAPVQESRACGPHDRPVPCLWWGLGGWRLGAGYSVPVCGPAPGPWAT